MASTLLLCLSTLLFFLPSANFQVVEEGFISAFISDKGLDFVKDLLVDRAFSALTPLDVPQVEGSLKIPLVGKARIVLSNIRIHQVDVSSSYVKPGETGVVIVVSGATASLSMNWFYSCSTWLVPIAISDHGGASVQAEGMEVGLTLHLENQDGTLGLSVLDCGCYLESISIKLDGGASWLYQGLADAFEEQIESSIEKAVSSKVKEWVTNLGSQLQNLPKEIPMNGIATLNVTFVNDFVLTDSSIGFEINGLLTAMDQLPLMKFNHKKSLPSIPCLGPTKMVGISVREEVFNSALVTFFRDNLMTWIADQLPDQSLLNTAGWRFVIPQLFKKYPNDDIYLNFSAAAPPIATISNHDIDATISFDMTVNVFDAGALTPVICFAMSIDALGSVEIWRNTVVGTVRVDDFTLALKWSKVGNLHMHLVQSVVWAALRTMVLPYVNLLLRRGFPLPSLHGFALQNAEMLYASSRIVICGDVAFANCSDFRVN